MSVLNSFTQNGRHKIGRSKGIIVNDTLNSNINNSEYFIFFPPNAEHIRCMHIRLHRRKDQFPLRLLRDLRSR